jgi:restriction system protein
MLLILPLFLPLLPIIFLAIILLLVYPSLTKSSSEVKGDIGENQVNRVLNKTFRQSKYYLFSNVVLAMGDDKTQIDHVLISQFGIFVIETKNYQGWIFGGKAQKSWTQVIYKTKNTFQNPLHQNYKHVKFIENKLSVASDNLISMVVFTDNSEFKTEMPNNVVKLKRLPDAIREHSKFRFEKSTVDELANRLRESIQNR